MKFFRITLGITTLAFPAIAGAEILLPQGEAVGRVRIQKPAVSKAEVPASDPAGSDLIRFENGDIMHGEFGGIADGLIWKRQDIEQPIRFTTKNIQQVIFNGARSNHLSNETSFVTLISGDRIPGEIIAMSAGDLTLRSPIMGNLTIPRNRIRSLTPNPFNGKLHYVGPFTSDGWIRLGYREPEKDKDSEDDNNELKELTPSWVYSGAAFYSMERLPLVFDANLPDIGKLRFKVAYKAPMNLSVAFHADLTHPLSINNVDTPDREQEAEGGEETPAEEIPKPALEFEILADLHKNQLFQTIPWMVPGQTNHADFFGTCYVMNIHSSYPSLNLSSFGEDGQANNRRLSTARSGVSVPSHGEAEIEIRFDRPGNLVMLFIDGDYAAQWHDPGGYLAHGSSIGFLNTSSNQIRISDIIVTTWNGVLDSASSMEHPDRDVALLTNGTDRFSGILDRIEDGKAYMKTSYANIEIPIGDLSLIELHKNGQADLEDPLYNWKSEPATILFKPFGLIKVIPNSSTPKLLNGHSPFFGEINVNLESAVMLRLLNESPDISDWFDDF